MTMPSEFTPSKMRIESIDLLRGIVIILMCLDHTRQFYTNISIHPLDLDKTTTTLFLTRWVTHFCAPVFIFLAGTSAFISRFNGSSNKELSSYLFKRGILLLALELTLIHWFGWQFSFSMTSIKLGVIWAIGWCLICLSMLIYLPMSVITLLGVTIIFGHNALDKLSPENFYQLDFLWRILHERGSFEYIDGYSLNVIYPLIPWIGLCALGFSFGSVIVKQKTERRREMLLIGISLILVFLILRGINLYGNSTKWQTIYKNNIGAAEIFNNVQDQSSKKGFVSADGSKPMELDGIFTIFSFINCQKYPPSLCFLLMTMGPVLTLFPLFDSGTKKWMKPVIVFGRVPLFFYIIHLPLIHLSSGVLKYLFFGPPQEGIKRGFDLPVIYLMWVLITVALFFPCSWYNNFKKTHKNSLLSYF